MIQLANTIRSLALSNYIPFQGFNEEAIINRTQQHLDVTADQVRLALEIICRKG